MNLKNGVIVTFCNWSDPSCWKDGSVPTSGSNVTIENDREVTIDLDIVVDILYVEGTLIVGNQSDVTITVRDILINTGAGLVDSSTRAAIMIENGNFFAGSEQNPWSCENKLTINFTGDRFQPEFGAPYGTVPIGAKTIGVMGGLRLFGCPVQVRYGILENTISIGDTTMELNVDVSSWKQGDQLAIAPTSYDGREAEKVTIVSVAGRTVTFHPPVNFTHTGVDDTSYSYGHMGAEVSLLSRNIKLDGLQDSEGIMGGRIVVVKSDDGFTYRSGWAQIDNVEFVHMGQFGHTKPLDLRYPISFYHIGIQNDADPKRSFVTNSAIHSSYNGGIAVGDGVDGILVSGNIIYNCVGDGIEVHGENTIVVINVITLFIYRLLYQNIFLSLLLGNAEPEQKNLPAGINTINTKTAIVSNNRVAGGDGPAYKGHGESCTSSELCQNTNFTDPSSAISNVGHSTIRGYSIVKVPGRPCNKYANFYFWRILDFGIYTQAGGSEIHIRDCIFADVIVGIANLIIGNGKVLKHEHGDMQISIDRNIFIGRSLHHKCTDYDIRENALISTSGMTGKNRAKMSYGNGHTGIYIPFFLEQFNKFPKKNIDDPFGGYNSLNGRSCASGNVFTNYNDDAECSSRTDAVFYCQDEYIAKIGYFSNLFYHIVELKPRKFFKQNFPALPCFSIFE